MGDQFLQALFTTIMPTMTLGAILLLALWVVVRLVSHAWHGGKR